MQIFVKLNSGKTVTLDVTVSDVVKTIKEMVQDKGGLPDKFQRLIFGGKQLEDERTLGDYNIQTENTIFEVCRMVPRSQ
jgi:hypothetical protein